jgi:hypothetical protein
MGDNPAWLQCAGQPLCAGGVSRKDGTPVFPFLPPIGMPRIRLHRQLKFSAGRVLTSQTIAPPAGNDGSGNTEIGQNLYPKPPDMRQAETQNLTDGEIYYIIHNGIRLTGMPAWGDPGKDDDSWKLVLFIRHLPRMTSQEMKEMKTVQSEERCGSL